MAKCIRPPKTDWRSNIKNESRAYCYTCSRPSRVCLCSVITKENNICEIGILQHPNETGKTFNTAKVAQLSLTKSFLLTGISFDKDGEFNKKVSNYSIDEIGVLYPSASALPLSEAPSDLQCLFVVDGTWPEAKKILTKTEAFNSIQHYGFIPKNQSKYILRKEPSVDYVCTLEAIVESLRILENDNNAYSAMLKTLDAMLEMQADLKNNNSRHKSSPEFMAMKKRVKEIKRQLYTYNLDCNQDLLLSELKSLEKKLGI